MRSINVVTPLLYNGVATAEGTGFWTPEANRT